MGPIFYSKHLKTTVYYFIKEKVGKHQHSKVVSLTENSFLFSGEVTFIVGGDDTNSVEVYSPEGKCQHRLASVLNESDGMMMFYLPS